MGFNAAGVLAIAEVIVRPRSLVPKITIKDIRQLNLEKLKKKGITGIVIDRDNCITKPRRDVVVNELKVRRQEAWPQLIKTFGRKNVLIVSNSAGTRDDAGLLQAESVSRQLGVPVLLHAVKKPGCSKAVIQYFEYKKSLMHSEGKGKGREVDYTPVPVVDILPPASGSQHAPPTHTSPFETISSSAINSGIKVLVIGDRVMTDIVLANRINRRTSATSKGHKAVQAIPVLTTTIWEMERPGSQFMRALESFVMTQVVRFQKRRQKLEDLDDWTDCLHPIEPMAKPIPATETVPAHHNIPPYRIPLHYLYLFGVRLTSPLRNFYTSRMKKYRSFLRKFILEAKHIYYGFKYPEGMAKFRQFKKLVDGEIGQSRINMFPSRIKRE